MVGEKRLRRYEKSSGVKKKGCCCSTGRFNSVAQKTCDEKFGGDKVAYLKSIGYAV